MPEDYKCEVVLNKAEELICGERVLKSTFPFCENHKPRPDEKNIPHNNICNKIQKSNKLKCTNRVVKEGYPYCKTHMFKPKKMLVKIDCALSISKPTKVTINAISSKVKSGDTRKVSKTSTSVNSSKPTKLDQRCAAPIGGFQDQQCKNVAIAESKNSKYCGLHKFSDDIYVDKPRRIEFTNIDLPEFRPLNFKKFELTLNSWYQHLHSQSNLELEMKAQRNSQLNPFSLFILIFQADYDFPLPLKYMLDSRYSIDLNAFLDSRTKPLQTLHRLDALEILNSLFRYFSVVENNYTSIINFGSKLGFANFGKLLSQIEKRLK